MGQATIERNRRANLLATEPRCIYCSNAANTIEHMPPRSLFRGKQRPKGLEFACCNHCNNWTSAADLVAAYFARLGAHEKPGDWAYDESIDMEAMLRVRAPGVLEEIHNYEGSKDVWVHGRNGVLERMKQVHVEGPVVRAYLTVFSGKMGMAMFREHVGRAMPMSGMVQTLYFLNGGLSPEMLETLLEDLPKYDILRQGAFNSHGQFDYRYSTDGQTSVVGFARLQTGLHVLFSATEDEQTEFLEGGGVVRPGEVASRLPVKIPTP